LASQRAGRLLLPVIGVVGILAVLGLTLVAPAPLSCSATLGSSALSSAALRKRFIVQQQRETYRASKDRVTSSHLYYNNGLREGKVASLRYFYIVTL
jgi:hypothetical protein